MKSNGKKNAVITGATGMLALALIRRLAAEGYHIYAVVRPCSAKISNIPKIENITIVSCDLQEMNKLPDIVGERCEAFYHFAWDGTYGASRDDMELQTKNIQAAVSAAEAAVKLGCKVFLGAGSQAEFGKKDTMISPNISANPETGYGIAKLCAGQMTRIVCHRSGIKHIWCRIFSTYGPYDGSQTMVMSVINRLLNGEKPSCTEGGQLWDYLYCDDAAEAFYLAAERGKDGAVYCVGSGKTKLLREYITDIRNAIDSELDIGFGEVPYFPNQVMHLCADISSLKNDTGFVPKHTFSEGIRKTVDWVKNKND